MPWAHHETLADRTTSPDQQLRGTPGLHPQEPRQKRPRLTGDTVVSASAACQVTRLPDEIGAAGHKLALKDCGAVHPSRTMEGPGGGMYLKNRTLAAASPEAFLLDSPIDEWTAGGSAT